MTATEALEKLVPINTCRPVRPFRIVSCTIYPAPDLSGCVNLCEAIDEIHRLYPELHPYDLGQCVGFFPPNGGGSMLELADESYAAEIDRKRHLHHVAEEMARQARISCTTLRLIADGKGLGSDVLRALDAARSTITGLIRGH